MNAFSLPVGAGNNTFASARARIIERRTYLRPLDEDGQKFETRDQMLDRVISHQRWLWEGVVKRKLDLIEEAELAGTSRLYGSQSHFHVGARQVDGRNRRREGARRRRLQLLLYRHFQPRRSGRRVLAAAARHRRRFKPITGLLEGFNPAVKNVEVVPSTRTDKGGAEKCTETFENGVWTLYFGDSAKSWAKALGKLAAGKYPAHTIRIDLSNLRPGGKRLRGYGWLCSGWEPLAKAMESISRLMIEASGRLLTAIEIGDIVNHLGTVLSSRRSAQIWLLDYDDLEIEDFTTAKIGRYENGKEHREQSNNTVLFWQKPERQKIVDLLKLILEGGDPGFANAANARRRAPEFSGLNPCAEILLPSKGFCNLVQVVFHRFNGDLEGLKYALRLAARANYRQTCVSMRDGVLQLAWENNQHLLRLCGVSPTGYVSWDGMNDPAMLEAARDAAVSGANSMADELGAPRPRRVTQCQASRDFLEGARVGR